MPLILSVAWSVKAWNFEWHLSLDLSETWQKDLLHRGTLTPRLRWIVPRFDPALREDVKRCLALFLGIDI